MPNLGCGRVFPSLSLSFVSFPGFKPIPGVKWVPEKCSGGGVGQVFPSSPTSTHV